jgi:hypothetical protein
MAFRDGGAKFFGRWRISSLTTRYAKAYQAVGVNFLPMSASNELEPGPKGLRLVTGMVAPGAEGVRKASRESSMIAQADGRGGFTGG